MLWLGLDLGKRRIGVAASDELGWVHPVTVIERRGNGPDIEQVERIFREREAGAVVVGLPLNMDDSEGPAARGARRFAERLRKLLNCRVELWDERLTSFEAEQMLQEAGLDSRRRRRVVDQMAAVLILRSFLASDREQ